MSQACFVGPRTKRELFQTLRGLNGVPLVRVCHLRQAWPKVPFTQVRSSNSPPAGTDVTAVIPSLANMSLDTAVKHALEEDNPENLEGLTWVPGKAAQIKATLRGLATLPAGGVWLLRRVLEETKELQSLRIDLSKIQLTSEQLLEIVSSCGDTVKTLDFSYNSHITADTLPSIVTAAPSVRRLILMNCPAIKSSRLLALVRNQPGQLKSLEGILHPALLTMEKPDPYPAAFTFVNFRPSGNLACVSLPLFTPAQIIQGIADAVPWRFQFQRWEDDPRAPADHALPMVGCSAFHSGVREPGESFGARPVVSVPFLTPKVPRDATSLWIFFLRYSKPGRSTHGLKNGWAFLHLTHRSATPRKAPIGDAKRAKPVPLHKAYSAKVHDLDGFLEAMQREGRPMPSEDAVRHLRMLLSANGPGAETHICPFIANLQLSELEMQTNPNFPAQYLGQFYL